MVPFAFFENDGEEEVFWMLGFALPFKVFMTLEETGERVRAGAYVESIDVRSGGRRPCQSWLFRT
jgi:hypothetical protein